MAMGRKFNSVETRLIVILLFLTILPTIPIAWLARDILVEHIRLEKMDDVGRVADAKHAQLTAVLTRANDRTQLFLSDLAAQCNAAKLDRACAARLMVSYMISESASGITLHTRGVAKDLSIGTIAQYDEADLKFKTGQLAKFSGSGMIENRSYFISVAEPSGRLRMEVLYPSSNLQPVFDSSHNLGKTGESFLTDGKGYFVTRARYPSTQGISHPIHAHPMLSCLKGESAEILDLDYRDSRVVHGFRPVPEFGSACIMAHIDQREAFAPIAALEKKLALAALVFFPLAFLIVLYIARKIAKPLTGLAQVAHAIKQGDYTARAKLDGLDEFSGLAAAFNSMTEQLIASHDELQQKAAELTNQKHLLRRVIDSDPNFIFVKDSEGRFLLANEAMAKSYGQTTMSIVGKCNRDLVDDPEQINAYNRSNSEVLDTLEERAALEKATVGDGERHWFHTIRKPLIWEEGSPSVLTIAMDITELKCTQEELQKVNRGLMLLSACNSLLVRIENEETLLDQVCKLIVETGEYRMAWVGFARQDKNKTICPVAKSGFEDGYLDSIEISWADTEYGNGPTGMAIRTGTPQVNQDYLTNPVMTPWRDEAQAHGFQSSIALPLAEDGITFGVLTIHSEKPDSFGSDEVELLEKLANELAFGIIMQRLCIRHKHAMTELKKSEEKFKSLVEHLPQKIFIKDINSIYLSCNEHYAQDVKMDPSTIAGKSDFDFYPKELAEKYRTDDKRVMDSGEVADFEEAYILNGQERFTHTIKVPFRTREGQIVGVLGIFWDITERKVMEKSRNQLSEAIRHSWEAIALADKNYRFIYINPAFSRLFGYSMEEVSGKLVDEIIGGEEPASGQSTQAFANANQFRRETLRRTKDGRIVPVLLTISSVHDDDGRPTSYITNFSNLTELKQAEEELRRQRLFMWQVIDTTPNLIFVKDASGKCLLVNQALADYWGLTIQEMIGKNISDFGSNEQEIQTYIAMDRQVIESGRELVSTVSSIRSDGQRHWYLITKRALVESDGTVNVLGIVVDITEQKLSEMRLAKSYQELRQLSSHQEHLREDEREKIARDLHDEMGSLLVALKMRVAWLTSKLPVGMPLLVEEAGHISALVKDAIHAVHQIVTKMRPNLLEGFGFAATVEDYVRKFQQQTGIECILVLPDEELALNAEQSIALFRILQESLNNVTKHAQASRVVIRIMKRDMSLSLIIGDNGIGFDMTVRKEQSFGLIGIRERALLMGGKVRIRSVPTKGTRLSITMPVHK